MATHIRVSVLVLILLVLSGMLTPATCFSCNRDSDCNDGERCSGGNCVVDSKANGEGCVDSNQCSGCCTRDYKCSYANETTPCKDDLDKTGLGVSLALAGVMVTATVVLAVNWAHKYRPT